MPVHVIQSLDCEVYLLINGLSIYLSHAYFYHDVDFSVKKCNYKEKTSNVQEPFVQ